MEGAWQVPGSSWQLTGDMGVSEYGKGLQKFLRARGKRIQSAFWRSQEGNKGLTGNRRASVTKKVLVVALAPALEGFVAGVGVMST